MCARTLFFFVRKDSLQGDSSNVDFSDPLLGELCSIAESPQATRALVLFEEFEPQTVDLCNFINRKTEEVAKEASPSTGAPCEKEGGNGLTEREGGSPTEQGDHPFPAGSLLASSEEKLALVIFDPRSVDFHDTLDVGPVDSRPPTELTAEAASKRVLAEVMDFSKILVLSFAGQEDRAADLFSSIENRRLKELQELEKKSVTPISRDSKDWSAVPITSPQLRRVLQEAGKRLDEKAKLQSPP